MFMLNPMQYNPSGYLIHGPVHTYLAVNFNGVIVVSPFSRSELHYNVKAQTRNN